MSDDDLHPRIKALLASGDIGPGDAQWMSDYAKTPGKSQVETGTGAYKDQSEKMQNFIQRMQNGEVPIPKHWQGPGGISVGGGQSDSGDVKRTNNIGSSGGGSGGDGLLRNEISAKNPVYKKGGKVSSASKRGDGCCIKGKTKGRFV